ncbi:MAG: hypothetical protein C5B49_14275 [Bdellovibrio sp.]|nr:MAG: hypothetical protein C5B49_14275 [Bdellovibrio sp.]
MLPEAAARLTNQKAEFEANCLNATLIWHLPDFKIFVTRWQEFGDMLDENFTKVSPDEALHFGDIIAISHTGLRHQFMHAMIYINPDYVWHKNSMFLDDPWTFEPFDQALKYWNKQLENRIVVSVHRKKVPHPR